MVLFNFDIIGFTATNLLSEENKMIMKLKYGEVEIELFEDIAPKHVERVKHLANKECMMELFFIEL